MTTGRRTSKARSLASRIAALAGFAALVGSGAAHGQVPGTMNFQGLLLNSGGQPKGGTVTLVFALYDTPTGGTALWTETLPNVLVTDGIYDVVLGATNPFEPADFASATRYLQITVDGEVLAPRRQLLVVPYAIRAEAANTANSATNAAHATTADSATTATTAATATAALNVGGIPAAFVSQVYQYTDFDNNGLLNSSPLEGIADIDGDGLASFVDADNDGDGLSDATEVSQGSNPNQLTATLTGFSPTTLPAWAAGSVTVNGTGFNLLSNIIVGFGAQPPRPPTNVTATSFEVSVDKQPVGTRPVVITSTNGNTLNDTFGFTYNPVIAFVTSTSYNGDLRQGGTGLAGADAKCQARATAAGLPLASTYKAWINDGADNSRVSDQADQWMGNSFALVNPAPPPNNVPIQFASDYTDLVDGPTHSPIFNRTETGAMVLNGTPVWTGGGTTSTGFHCGGWTDASTPPPPPGPLGRIGRVGEAENWQNDETLPCSQPARLYCFRH